MFAERTPAVSHEPPLLTSQMSQCSLMVVKAFMQQKLEQAGFNSIPCRPPILLSAGFSLVSARGDIIVVVYFYIYNMI